MVGDVLVARVTLTEYYLRMKEPPFFVRVERILLIPVSLRFQYNEIPNTLFGILYLEYTIWNTLFGILYLEYLLFRILSYSTSFTHYLYTTDFLVYLEQ